MAGGTGGHVFPALAVADWLRSQGCAVFWLGSRHGMEASLVAEHGYPMESIDIKGIRSAGLKRHLLAPFVLAKALYQAWRIIRRRRPVLALGMGGFASGPGGMMSWVGRVPLVIHEQNAIPGLTNSLLARLAIRVFEAFPDSFPQPGRAEAVGNPVRGEIAALEVPESRLAKHQGRPRLLVLGGSLGAQALNQIIPQALARLDGDMRPQVRHQSGQRTYQLAQSAYAEAGVDAELTEFISDMAEAYSWADLVIARAGALTISELAAAGLGSILVPFPHAVDDHQTRNAGYLVNNGAAVLMPQSELNPDALSALLNDLLTDRRKLLDMAQAARKQARPEAAERVGQACLEECKR
jgi:UDP-N-acetylglucosamine--N-acetylmuramyl-(pentapeptide) pyrophosphoryl-undecaprenol N-acetylglucosamine transferase